MKLLGYCENRICEQVSMIGFEDTERKTSTLVEECILNCSTKGIFKISKSHTFFDKNGPDDIQELLYILICFQVKRFHRRMVEERHIV